jgi:hypothetical protein
MRSAPHAVCVSHLKCQVALRSCRRLVQLTGLRQRLLPVGQGTLFTAAAAAAAAVM